MPHRTFTNPALYWWLLVGSLALAVPGRCRASRDFTCLFHAYTDVRRDE